jgi:hypothetical protein
VRLGACGRKVVNQVQERNKLPQKVKGKTDQKIENKSKKKGQEQDHG